jgi:hypothetical protein
MGAVTRELAAVKAAKEGLEQSHASATAALAVATRQLADTTHQLTDMTAREASRHQAAQAAQTQLVSAYTCDGHAKSRHAGSRDGTVGAE